MDFGLINKHVFVGKAKNKWNSHQPGRIVGIGNDRYYIVRFEDGRKTWIRKNWILLRLP